MKKYKPVFYVVTRGGRRASERDYWTKGEADQAASRLRAVLRHWNDPQARSVQIVKTAEPDSVS